MSAQPVVLALLASGLSTRFGGDKLMAELQGKPVLSYAAAALQGRTLTARMAVVGTAQNERRALLEAAGWSLIDNTAPEAGQGAALALAAEAALARSAAIMLVTLADMPFVPDSHLDALLGACRGGADAVLSEAGGVAGPPAAFAARALAVLRRLSGDHGAKAALGRLSRVQRIRLEPAHFADIDTKEDLARLNEAPLSGHGEALHRDA